MRVGIFGGSFDPPHRGHRAVALAAAHEFRLERVLLAPAGRQPLKPAGSEASFPDRLAMVALLCQGQPALEASAIDAPRADGVANFTIDTLRRLQLELKAQQPSANPEIFVLVGADAFLGLRRWRDPDALLTLAEWIVVSRPGFDRERIGDLQLASAQLRRVHWLDGVAEPASGTAIREALRNGEDPGALLPPGVLTYIRTHRLYQAPAV